ESIAVPSLYFAHRREVFRRDGQWLALTPFVTLLPGDEPREMTVRFRTVGDATCTGAVESTAASVEEIIMEVAAARVTERGGRADDRRSEAAMEDRKRQGYF
ncbi:MAG TPA: sulfate adenylyltransferase small subunit, partial [Longimicrobium sp.]|nr:sulfate adenylyltransferase small subunit [Longimicrobium sp.]